MQAGEGDRDGRAEDSDRSMPAGLCQGGLSRCLRSSRAPYTSYIVEGPRGPPGPIVGRVQVPSGKWAWNTVDSAQVGAGETLGLVTSTADPQLPRGQTREQAARGVLEMRGWGTLGRDRRTISQSQAGKRAQTEEAGGAPPGLGAAWGSAVAAGLGERDVGRAGSGLAGSGSGGAAGSTDTAVGVKQ